MQDAEVLRPSSEEFVLRIPPGDEATLARARRLGPVERLPAQRGLALLRVPQQATPEASWTAALRALGADVELLPVLYDRDGAQHFPTGEVTVRFAEAPSDAELARFCEVQRLRLLRRNTFVAAQAVCAPASPSTDFLPKLVARVAAQPGVHRAWANTLSAYRRTGK